MKRNSGLNQLETVLVVLAIFVASTGIVYWAQAVVEQNAIPATGTASTKDQFEMAKIAAEIRQIRSDTTGSLFWLKMIGLFVTVVLSEAILSARMLPRALGLTLNTAKTLKQLIKRSCRNFQTILRCCALQQ